MNDSLQPMSLGEVLDRTAHIFRTRFLVYLGIGGIPAGTTLVFGLASIGLLVWMNALNADEKTFNPQTLVPVGLLGLLGLVALPAYLGANALGWAALCHATARTHLGEAITIRGAYSAVWKRGWRYVGLFLLLGLIIVGAPALAFVGGTFLFVMLAALGRASGAGQQVASLAGFGLIALMLVLLAVAVWLLLRLALVYPSSVVEDLRPWQAIKRGNTLSRGTRGRIFLLLLLGTALNYLLLIIVFIPLLIGISLIPGMNAPQNAERLGQYFSLCFYGISFLLQAVIKPVYGIAITIFYYDQRVRTEGFDIEWMMQQAGMAPPPPRVEPEAAPWLPPVAPANTVSATPTVESTAPLTSAALPVGIGAEALHRPQVPGESA